MQHVEESEKLTELLQSRWEVPSRIIGLRNTDVYDRRQMTVNAQTANALNVSELLRGFSETAL